jgi:hypothetical protein
MKEAWTMNIADEQDILRIKPDRDYSGMVEITPPEDELENYTLSAAILGLQHSLVNRDSLVTASQIEKLLRGRSSVVRSWISQHLTPVDHPTGRALYLWADVLDALGGDR